VKDVRVVVLGHVDHGKSTLIGRLLYDTEALAPARVEEIVSSSRRRGRPVEWSFALDALQDERDQAITIGTTRVWFSVRGRRYVVIDAPGHEEFLASAMTGASDADTAILVVDAVTGVEDQTRRHAYLLALLAVPRVVVALNKIDAVGFDPGRFAHLETEVRAMLDTVGIEIDACVPLSARDGDNVASLSSRTPWYEGPPLLDVLGSLAPERDDSAERSLRLSIQDVYRNGDERIAVGVVRSGRINVGDEVRITPAATNVRIAALRAWPENPTTARAGETVGIAFSTPAFVERGDVLSGIDAPPHVARTIRLRAFWFDRVAPQPEDVVRLRAGSADVAARITDVHEALDPATLAPAKQGAVARGTVYVLSLRTTVPLALDDGDRCALARGGLPIAAARVVAVEIDAPLVFPPARFVSRLERAVRNGHDGRIIWLTGLPASGKSTIATAVERELFERGYQVVALDGDAVRTGLTRDLDFSPEGRAENVRRVAEAAKLFAETGTIALVSLVSPTRADRAHAREIGGTVFREVFVRATVETCAKRDPKGLYARAFRGELRGFTGVDALYEEPTSPELVLDTERDDVSGCVTRLLEFVSTDARITPATGTAGPSRETAGRRRTRTTGG
jgi:bifunctional enzyme CysN/CysC